MESFPAVESTEGGGEQVEEQALLVQTQRGCHPQGGERLMAVAWEGHCVISASQGMLRSATRTAGRQPAWVW